MIQSILVKLLLAPFSLLYGLGVSIRNIFYKNEVLRPAKFDIPIISIGNLSIGGTGKSPHIEYLIEWLKEYIPVAVLSRGYKRNTTGFLLGSQAQDVMQLGDEPYQFMMKYPDTPVAVSESRELGIPMLLKYHPETKIILLDDAFQHLSVKPYINILLTAYASPFTDDYLLPSGRLREWRSSYTRADIIIVTKCPDRLTPVEAKPLITKINARKHQSVFFTEYRYKMPYFVFNPALTYSWKKESFVLLVSGIANTDYLENYIKQRVSYVHLLSFADHHWFSNYDLGQVKRHFDELPGPDKVIMTTEKDATRLQLHRDYILEHKLLIFVLPVEVSFLWNEEDRFKDTVAQKLLEFKA